MANPASEQPIRRITALDVLRLLSELAAFAILALWGFLAWPFWSNIVFGIVTPGIAIVLWALFVSPKAVLSVHPFIRIVVELMVFVGATIALWGLDLPWLGLGFGVAAVAIGLAHRLRSL
ncbi:YrdB family protein [Microbacterium halophytorum]|uniref:YrdB family protein n=1 Tax=Microbacterium halophytorum TaxID=2067568 RepID=UPI000CFB3B5E|nr:YrdB family protein [Microbacterium halophytorum]